MARRAICAAVILLAIFALVPARPAAIGPSVPFWGPANVAAAANGGVATASSSYSLEYAPQWAIDGNRRGDPWGAGGGWSDATENQWPDWLQVTFSGSQTIGEVDVFSVQDAFTAPSEPTASQTFTKYGLTAFQVQYWDGSRWVTVPGGTIAGNQQVWRQVTFPSVTTTAIRISVTSGQAGFSRIAEVEAWTPRTTPVPIRAADGLLQKSSLVYQGAFRLPLDDSGMASFSYGGTSLGFNPSRESLFLVGHDQGQLVGEVSIPRPSTAGAVSGLPVATLLQPLVDVTEGRLASLNPGDPNAQKVGGLLPYAGRLYVSGYSYYDGAGTQVLTHFVSDPDLSLRGDIRGPFKLAAPKAGYVSGYTGLVPSTWRSTFGGPALVGQCCLSIISRTSYGPALFSFNPEDVGVASQAPTTALLYYPSSHPLGEWNSTNTYFNGATEVRGVVFPEGTRSVLFFGRHGRGNYCYGEGTANASLAGTAVPKQAGVSYCYDPESLDKGTHAYPYSYYVWAYDASDLAAVKTGLRQPWELLPYATWDLDLPYSHLATHLGGAAYDPTTDRIFVSQSFSDGHKPLIHVFTIAR